jgi:hypothetical protein
MNFQVVARFLATTAHNHECRPVIKPLRYPKNEKLPENSQDRYRMRNFLPCRQYLTFSVRVRSWQTTTERKYRTVVMETMSDRGAARSCENGARVRLATSCT